MNRLQNEDFLPDSGLTPRLQGQRSAEMRRDVPRTSETAREQAFLRSLQAQDEAEFWANVPWSAHSTHIPPELSRTRRLRVQ